MKTTGTQNSDTTYRALVRAAWDLDSRRIPALVEESVEQGFITASEGKALAAAGQKVYLNLMGTAAYLSGVNVLRSWADGR